MDPAATALNSHVLVLNKMWMAVRVVDARRAFALLCKDLAEVIRVDDGSYTGYDFGDWTDLSEDYHRLFPEAGGEDHYEWVRTVRMKIAVPKVIRLLGYDRLPRNEVKLNRRNIFARARSDAEQGEAWLALLQTEEDRKLASEILAPCTTRANVSRPR